MICITYIETPVGKMRAGATDEGICLFDFEYRRIMDKIMARLESGLNDTVSKQEHYHFKALRQQVAEYFSGERKDFDLPLHLVGTPFQKQVWRALLEIPYGEIRSYKQQSVFLGDEKAIRAVAHANGENSIVIIVPCHRVIGSNGSLTGYGGGLKNKQWLLNHEKKHSGKDSQMNLFA